MRGADGRDLTHSSSTGLSTGPERDGHLPLRMIWVSSVTWS